MKHSTCYYNYRSENSGRTKKYMTRKMPKDDFSDYPRVGGLFTPHYVHYATYLMYITLF